MLHATWSALQEQASCNSFRVHLSSLQTAVVSSNAGVNPAVRTHTASFQVSPPSAQATRRSSSFIPSTTEAATRSHPSLGVQLLCGTSLLPPCRHLPRSHSALKPADTRRQQQRLQPSQGSQQQQHNRKMAENQDRVSISPLSAHGLL